MTMRLPWRLFISYALVIAIGTAVAYVTIRLLAPTFFDQEISGFGGQAGPFPGGQGGQFPGGQGGPPGNVHSAFLSALTTALLVAPPPRTRAGRARQRRQHARGQARRHGDAPDQAARRGRPRDAHPADRA